MNSGDANSVLDTLTLDLIRVRSREIGQDPRQSERPAEHWHKEHLRALLAGVFVDEAPTWALAVQFDSRHFLFFVLGE
jgi:hypothetical protein